MVRICFTDLLQGDPWTFLGLVDWLIYDKNIPLERLLTIGSKQLQVSRDTLLSTLKTLV